MKIHSFTWFSPGTNEQLKEALDTRCYPEKSTFHKNKSINTKQSFNLLPCLLLNESGVEKLIKLKVMAATLSVN